MSGKAIREAAALSAALLLEMLVPATPATAQTAQRLSVEVAASTRYIPSAEVRAAAAKLFTGEIPELPDDGFGPEV